MKSTLKVTLSLPIVTLLGIFSPSMVNAAEVTTQFCVLTSKTHGGSDSKGIYINLTNEYGISTGDLNLDKPGRNDFIAGQWGCFEFAESDLQTGADIGFHTKAVMSIKEDQDDFCVKQMFSRRYTNFNPTTGKGTLLSTSQFGSKSKTDICFGDYNNKSKKSRLLNTWSPTPTAKILKVKTDWNTIVSHNGPISQSVTVGSTRTHGSTKTKEWNLSVTIAAEAEAGAPGNSLKISTAVTASTGGSSAISQSVSASKATTIQVGCPNEEKVLTTLYQKIITVQHSDGTPTVTIPLQEFNCVKR